MVRLEDGSLVLAAVGTDERAIPRIDTEDATVYLDGGRTARASTTIPITERSSSRAPARPRCARARATTACTTGEYLMVHGDEEPEIEQRRLLARPIRPVGRRPLSSRDYETRSASASYVDEDYASDVVALDGYGDWSYNDTYGLERLAAQRGSGLEPVLERNLVLHAGRPDLVVLRSLGLVSLPLRQLVLRRVLVSGWCWASAYVYSPAWVYWAYSPGYVGWCPVGWYGFYSPWCNNYYRQWGWTGRGGVYLSVHGTLPGALGGLPRMELHGLRRHSAPARRMDVIPGSRMGGRLGETVAISSRPIVVAGETRRGAPAVQSFVREAPRAHRARPRTGDSTRLAPVLARERTLPARPQSTPCANHAVVADRGRLTGPGVADIAPRGTIVDRTPRSTCAGPTRRRRRAWRTLRVVPETHRPDRSLPASGLGRSAPNRIEPHTVVRGDSDGVQAVPSAREDWRGSRPSRSADGSASPARSSAGTRRPPHRPAMRRLPETGVRDPAPSTRRMAGPSTDRARPTTGARGRRCRRPAA